VLRLAQCDLSSKCPRRHPTDRAHDPSAGGLLTISVQVGSSSQSHVTVDHHHHHLAQSMQDIIEHADLYNENGQVIYGTLHINLTQCLPELERLFFFFFFLVFLVFGLPLCVGNGVRMYRYLP
jgi:hypothetical protein